VLALIYSIFMVLFVPWTQELDGFILRPSMAPHDMTPLKIEPVPWFLVETQRLQATSSPRSASFETAPARRVLGVTSHATIEVHAIPLIAVDV
jgi:hypothetical protein